MWFSTLYALYPLPGKRLTTLKMKISQKKKIVIADKWDKTGFK